MEDGKIIEMFFARDEGALAAVSEKYGSYCAKIAANILGSRESSEECVNDTWLRVWKAIPPQKPQSLRAFLGCITRNLSLNRLREQSRDKRAGDSLTLALGEMENCIPDMRTPERICEDGEIIASVRRFLETLTCEQRVAFLRRYWFFDSLDEISERMGWSRSKTNSLLRRLRLKLRKHFEVEDILL